MKNKYAMISMIAACMCSVPALARAEAWHVSESNGQVWVLHSGQSRAAIQGASVDTGDIVATGKGGRAVLVRGEEYMVVSPNSRLRIAQPETSGSLNQIFEEFGTVVFRIEKKLTAHFGVDTPYLAAVVKGTTFSVTVTEAGAAVQVIEGAVQVSTLDGGASHLVTPGVIGQVQKGDLLHLRVDDGGTSAVETSPTAPASAEVSTGAKSQTVGPNNAATGIAVGESQGSQGPQWSFTGESNASIAGTGAQTGSGGLTHSAISSNAASGAAAPNTQNTSSLLAAANGGGAGGVTPGAGVGTGGSGNAGGVTPGAGAGTGGSGNAGGVTPGAGAGTGGSGSTPGGSGSTPGGSGSTPGGASNLLP